jgi:predicted fused transcriptional regulator/phosphomethylpyrimidine kinase
MSIQKIADIQSEESRLIAEVVKSETLIKTLDNCKTHEHVVRAMAKFGYKVSKDGLDREMKHFIETSETVDGVPEWVRLRARVLIHD